LTITPIHGREGVRAFFDAQAVDYREAHGDEARLLRYRLSIVRRHARFGPDSAVLEIGCGDGRHLLGVGGDIGRGVGIDLSPRMIEAARAKLKRSPSRGKLAFQVGSAEELTSLASSAFDVVFCVGALEHMLDHAGVCRSVWRVLRPGGRFVCLTINGGHVWYRRLAPLLGIEMRHLSTDHFLECTELVRLLQEAGFREIRADGWTFVQRGDIPRFWAAALGIADTIGRLTRTTSLRGGLVIGAYKES
jgi:2-polyprenyl-6-hydroxyphenyl methylase/3-demethylubiquinone-9 3-methyltransferase